MEINGQVPKKVKLIVNKGQDLQLYHPKKQIKKQPCRWRVLFLGVVEKLATAKVDSDTGNPEWLCEITVTAKNARDPISLLVTDSKGRHIGQVLVPLSQIPPRPPDSTPGSRPPLVFSNIYKSELEPTNKNSYPKGFLYYWMWAEDYWKLEEIVKLNTKKSLSKSMHDLSNSTLNLFRRKKSTTSFQESELSPNNIRGRTSTDVSLRASPMKVNNLKKRSKPGSDSSSPMFSQCGTRSGTMPNSPVMNGLVSKNPFENMMTTDISIENNIELEQPYQPESTSNKQRQGLFTKFRIKKSQSSADLSKIASGNGQANVFYPLPQSLGKQQGQRIMDCTEDFSKFSIDAPAPSRPNLPIPSVRNNSRRMNRPQSCSIRMDNDPNCNLLSNKNPFNNDLEQMHAYKSQTYNGDISIYNTTDTPISNKNFEDMNRRELIDLLAQMENQLKAKSVCCRNIERNSAQLNNEKKRLHDELLTVKDELSRLKFRLLEAGDTKYLEKAEPKTRSEVLSDLTLWRANSKI